MYNTAVAIAPATYQKPATPTIYLQAQSFSGDLFSRFIDYTDRKDTTVKGYLTCIRQFMNWLNENQISQPQRDDIKAYRDYLASRDLSAGTQQQYLRAVKHFFKWTAAEGFYPNIADNIHGTKVDGGHKRDALKREAVPKIAESIDRTDEQGKRLYAIYMLCTNCGLRTVEINRANIEDLQTLDGEPFLFIQRKGHDGKDAPVYLVPEVKKALDDYLQHRSAPRTAKSPLFTSTSNRSKGGRIATTTISTMLKELLVSAGYDSRRLTAHSLRHTSATSSLKTNGGNIYLTQKLMGHKSPTTTEVYVHDDANIQNELEGRKAIYDYLFTGKTITPILPELKETLEGMSEAEQAEILKFIRERNK